ncbi:MAG: ABC transporter permease [Chloroflexi bacterium]|nr:ABC transporter permease [Chloroflexota bacterium]
MLLYLVAANLKMLFRNRQSIFWALLFPLIFVVVFGLFNLDETPTTKVLVVDYSRDQLSKSLVKSLDDIETLKMEEAADEAKARQDLRDGERRFLLILPQGLGEDVAAKRPVKITLIYDESSAVSAVIIGLVRRFVDGANLELADAQPLLNLESQGILSRQTGYFDFLLPGFIGLGVMTYSIIGLASNLAVWREKKIFKRLLATPLRIQTFFAAVIVSFLVLSLIQAAIILVSGMLLFDAHFYGNYFYLLVFVVFGNLVFLNLGFIVGAFAKTVSAASGLGNVVSLPMMFLSGTFFPTDTLPAFLRWLVQYLPLSPLLEGMRGIATDARPLWDFPQEMAILGVWIIVTAFIAVKVFKFR